MHGTYKKHYYTVKGFLQCYEVCRKTMRIQGCDNVKLSHSVFSPQSGSMWLVEIFQVLSTVFVCHGMQRNPRKCPIMLLCQTKLKTFRNGKGVVLNRIDNGCPPAVLTLNTHRRERIDLCMSIFGVVLYWCSSSFFSFRKKFLAIFYSASEKRHSPAIPQIFQFVWLDLA